VNLRVAVGIGVIGQLPGGCAVPVKNLVVIAVMAVPRYPAVVNLGVGIIRSKRENTGVLNH
jgi:hypothetical protein